MYFLKESPLLSSIPLINTGKYKLLKDRIKKIYFYRHIYNPIMTYLYYNSKGVFIDYDHSKVGNLITMIPQLKLPIMDNPDSLPFDSLPGIESEHNIKFIFCVVENSVEPGEKPGDPQQYFSAMNIYLLFNDPETKLPYITIINHTNLDDQLYNFSSKVIGSDLKPEGYYNLESENFITYLNGLLKYSCTHDFAKGICNLESQSLIELSTLIK